MDDLNLLLRYATRVLLWIAPFEFLFGRAISRASRQMPAGDIGAAIFGAISAVGAFLVMPAFILALLILVASALLALRGPAPTLGRDGAGGVAWPRPLAALLLVFLVYNVGLLFPGAPRGHQPMVDASSPRRASDRGAGPNERVLRHPARSVRRDCAAL